MKFRTRFCTLLLAALLLLPAAASAQTFTDLPATHWAYADMVQAADLGVI